MNKVKSMLVHETHIEGELIKLQNELKQIYYEDFKAIRKIEFNMLHNARYNSRKNFRIMLLTEYMSKMKGAVDVSFGGEMGMAESADLMASVGIKGASPVKYHNLEIDNDNFYLNMYFDSGTYTGVDRTIRNDSTILLQTMTRLYIVSSQFLVGSPLSMAEVRVIKGIQPGCLIMIHINLHSYRVIAPGSITCSRNGKGKYQYDLQKGDFLHLEGRDFCRNECIEMGYRGYTNKYKNLPSLPPSQPAVLKHFFADFDSDNVPAPMKALEKSHQVSHDLLAVEIRENEDMLLELSNPDSTDTASQIGMYLSYIGTSISIILGIVFIGMCFKCRLQKSKNAQHSVPMKSLKILKDREDNEDDEV